MKDKSNKTLKKMGFGMKKIITDIEKMKQSHEARAKFLKEKGVRWEKLSDEDFKKYIEM